MTRARALRLSLFLGLPLVGVVALVLLWNWDWFVPLLNAQASAQLGRPVSVSHLHVRLGRVTTVVVDDLRVANPDGFAADPPLAQVAHVSAQVDVMHYIHGRVIDLPLIDVDHPVVEAVGRADGQNNYTLQLPASSSSASSNAPPPRIGELRIEDGHVHAVIAKLKADFALAVATRPAPDAVAAGTTVATSAMPSQIVVDAQGTYANQPVTGRLVGDALLSLQDAAHPYSVDLRAANGPTHVTLTGTIQDPLKFAGADLKLDFAGPDMALLLPLTGVAIPKTPSYHVSGQLDYADHRIRFRDFSGTLGNSDLAGTIAVDPALSPPDLTADLRSRRVDLADLGGFVGSEPGRANERNATPDQRRAVAKAEASSKLLPTTTISLPKLRAANVHLHYHGDHIEGRSMPLDNLTVAMDIVDGRITVHPVSFGVGAGEIAGTIDLAPLHDELIRAKADVQFKRVELAKLMAATHTFAGAGTIGGQAKLDATGNSVATFLGRGDGALDLYMSNGGNLSALLVDLSGLQFGNAILSALGVPNRAKVECFVGQFTLHQGVVSTRALVLDTSEGILNGTGTIDLLHEAMDYRLKTDAKHFSIGSLPTPIAITGTFKDPSIRPDVAELGVRGGLAVGLGVLLPPLALLPTIQFGVGEDGRCGRLMNASRAAAPAASP